ncbi:hypothetical protein BGZ65_009423 [Modicella reniformis]|uniref:Uncharacterized protein n=1 Tax=Modicella reniformis TaxID=1440133 RepID=A0A9P6MAX6_9FUNG|nr:hypothetical protein BGZ65_009423 [Modicella reniformis]
MSHAAASKKRHVASDVAIESQLLQDAISASLMVKDKDKAMLHFDGQPLVEKSAERRRRQEEIKKLKVNTNRPREVHKM